MVITIKKSLILFRLFAATIFLIVLIDLITSAKIYLYNNCDLGPDIVVRFLGMIISFEEIIYIHMFIEYFKNVTKGVDDEKITKRKEN